MTEKKSKIILALDQSTSATGWALFKNEKLLDYGVFRPSGGRDERIDDMRNWLENKIEELSLDADVALTVVLEDIQMQANVDTFKVLAQLQGVLINTIYRLKKNGKVSSSYIYFSTEWKKTLKITGRTSKEQKANAYRFVVEKYKIKVSQDACDAICLGDHHIYQINSEINFG